MMNITKKLPKEIKEIWVEALRSGEFTQGQMSLHPTETTDCCIGVLGKVIFAENYHTGGPYEYLDETTGFKTTHRLYDMNDCQGKSFSEIADWIEENL